jgi:hypothetical protein
MKVALVCNTMMNRVAIVRVNCCELQHIYKEWFVVCLWSVCGLPLLWIRAVLENLAHGPGPVSGPVWSHDTGQHLPGGLRL